MNWYVTYNDLPSGIFKSQVIDTVEFYNSSLNMTTRLISFISVRGFFANRRRIKKWQKSAIVLPMFPGTLNWRLTSIWMLGHSFFNQPDVIICRGVFAANMGRLVKKINSATKVVYDGRGAVSAEWREFCFTTKKQTLEDVEELERKAVLKADNRLAVSNQLVKYWKQNFNFGTGLKTSYTVIPCTIGEQFQRFTLNSKRTAQVRSELGIPTEALVLVYSGAVQGWQSTKLLIPWFERMILTYPEVHVLLLTQESEVIRDFISKYPQRAIQKWVKPNEVPELLSIANYGVLLRDNYITNQVASPTKFAEYLSVGLKVIISHNIGDFTELTKERNLGLVLKGFDTLPLLEEVDVSQKRDLIAFARQHFTKEAHIKNFQSLL